MNLLKFFYLFFIVISLTASSAFGQEDDQFWESNDSDSSVFENAKNISIYSPELEREYNETLENLRVKYKQIKNNIDLLNIRIKESDSGDEIYSYKKSQKKLQKELDKVNEELFQLQLAYSDRYPADDLSKRIRKVRKKYPLTNANIEKNTQKKGIINTSSIAFDYDEFYSNHRNLSERKFVSKLNCKLLSKGIDQNTGKKKVALESKDFFYFVHPSMQNQATALPYLTGKVSIVSIGKDIFLLLNISIKSKEAVRSYGYVSYGSSLRLTLMNRDYLYLKSATESRGTYNEESGYTNYYIYYLLDNGQQRSLKRYEVDEVGMMWTSGFEKYEIFNVDELKRQLTCIENY